MTEDERYDMRYQWIGMAVLFGYGTLIMILWPLERITRWVR
jgi:hypothetical protein